MFHEQADFGNTMFGEDLLQKIVSSPITQAISQNIPAINSVIQTTMPIAEALSQINAKVAAASGNIITPSPTTSTSLIKTPADDSLWENYKAPISLGIGYALGKFSFKGAIAGLIIYAILTQNKNEG
jgi:hypothetical protein